VVYLKATANLSTGGTADDVTEVVHPFNVFLAERISRIIDLDICGIDIMTDDISIPLNESGGAVLEVNAAPGFRMHLDPTGGIGKNVAEPVVDMLFPPGTPSRIPIIAVTGTNGKTTTTRLTAHLMRSVGLQGGHDVQRRRLHPEPPADER
jgi:cyanophycin synthetase